MASFKAKFPVLQELFAKNHRGALCPPPSGARVKAPSVCNASVIVSACRSIRLSYTYEVSVSLATPLFIFLIEENTN